MLLPTRWWPVQVATATRFTVTLWAATLLTGCFAPPSEPDCLTDGTCECKTKAQCQAGQLCVDGRCHTVVDAGQPGSLGWPCQTDSECTVGPCLPKGPGNGNVCTVRCNAPDAGTDCPRGWECKSASPTSVCVPPLQGLCLPCSTDQDCNAAGDRCLTLDGGSFCGQDCTLKGCPAHYQCRSVLLDGQVARQCVNETESCLCSPASVGLQRSCSRQGPLGVCYGFERCQSDNSFAGCDARLSSPEVCNGIDDDCDGLTDQQDPSLDTSQVPGFPQCKKGVSCTGLSFCGPLPDGGGSFQCSAPDPTPETCNGVDDDCNGTIDDGLRGADGGYFTPRACGECSNDCFVTIANLAVDAGPQAASCTNVSGALTCVPNQCAKGYYPAPVGAARHCEKALSPQCRPCTVDQDCSVPSDTCVAVGTDVGRFCAQSCEPTSPHEGCTGRVGERDCCPEGNRCQSVSGQKRCVPDSNSCVCPQSGVGFTRSCFKTAANASCVGAQVCQADGGFSDCDTSQVSLELCDGADNDCNGVVDDGLINTQGTGTYDTDEHCQSCANNCKARFSPTIQHAVGGCRPDAGTPQCRIVQCTSESVAGDQLCQTDGDCAQGKSCSPVFRQCVKACASAADCSAQEACSGGRCGRSCQSSGDCLGALGAGAVCTQGVCGFAYAFNDTDAEESNGCECAATMGVVDDPDTFAAYPTAGLPYVDRNCDRVDGTASSSLFVWAQSTNSRGTREAPYRTIAEAMAAFRVGTHSAILVAQGTYVEQVVLRDGVALYGGYASDFFRRDITSYPTLIEAPEPASDGRRGSLNAEGISSFGAVAGFTIRGYDVTSRPAAGAPARNTYAVYARDARALVLRNNHLVGGRGGDAVAATPGSAGSVGGTGGDGLNAKECASASCANETQNGGAGGINMSCAAGTSGNFGANAVPTADPQGYADTSGGNGVGGSNGVYRHSDPSQSNLCKYDCTVPQNGLNGQPASNGVNGQSASGGPGCSLSLGTLGALDWAPGAGFSGGTNATAGRGGGGGGAGGCVRNDNPATCTIGNRVGDLGATGGGGGAGGCAGSSGVGGGGGGGSFALFIVGALPKAVEGNLIDIGFGGSGGPGGAGGYGGLGGPGGKGGVNTSQAWCAGLGGPGGRGGTGGAGGGGGGGCGGAAAAIAGAGIAQASYAMKNTIAPAPINAAGAGGIAGASPAGGTSNGGSGSAGAVLSVMSF